MTDPFFRLGDDELGNTDYRLGTVMFQQKSCKSRIMKVEDWIKTKPNSRCQSLNVKRNDFKGEWPFSSDEVTIECIDTHWCTIIIDKKVYGLNGLAKSRFKLDDPYESGMAFIGKSVAPFIDMALELRKK